MERNNNFRGTLKPARTSLLIQSALDKIICDFKQYKENHINYWDQYFEKNYTMISNVKTESIFRSHILISPILYADIPKSKYIPKYYNIRIIVTDPEKFPFIGKIMICKLFTPFYISNADFHGKKNTKRHKINSRNFTYDGLTFSTSFLREVVKDGI